MECTCKDVLITGCRSDTIDDGIRSRRQAGTRFADHSSFAQLCMHVSVHVQHTPHEARGPRVPGQPAQACRVATQCTLHIRLCPLHAGTPHGARSAHMQHGMMETEAHACTLVHADSEPTCKSVCRMQHAALRAHNAHECSYPRCIRSGPKHRIPAYANTSSTTI